LVYNYVDDDLGGGYMTITEGSARSTRIDYFAGKITSITYPTGGKVEYKYKGILKTAGVKYDFLTERVQSDGGVYRFFHDGNTEGTFIRTIYTPSASIKYDYGYASSLKRFSSSSYNKNSGRLLRYRRSDLSSAVPLIDISYHYKKIRSISSRIRQDSDVVVTERTVSRMNQTQFNSNGYSTFIRYYQDYDYWGYPAKMVEISASGAERITRYTYRHTGFTRWLLGKVATTYVENEDGKNERRIYSYNKYGDKRSIFINGITTTYKWHENGESKGNLFSVTNGQTQTIRYEDYYRGIARKTTNAAGFVTLREVNDDGTLASETRPVNKRSTTNYCNLSTALYHETNAVRCNGLLDQFTDGYRTSYSYDQLGRMTRIKPIREQSSDTIITWKSNNEMHETDGQGRYERVVFFDEFGRIAVDGTLDMHQSAWSTVLIKHDSEGRVVLRTSPSRISAYGAKNILDLGLISNGTKYTYDALGRVKLMSIHALPSRR